MTIKIDDTVKVVKVKNNYYKRVLNKQGKVVGLGVVNDQTFANVFIGPSIYFLPLDTLVIVDNND